VFIVLPLVGGAVAAVVAPLFETAVPKSDVDPTGATVPEP
jgi:aquaporin Z